MKLTEGKIFKTLFIYSLPLILTNVVQLLFHAADVTVLGIMVSDYAVAAVGACGPIISLLVSLFASFATGLNYCESMVKYRYHLSMLSSQFLIRLKRLEAKSG